MSLFARNGPCRLPYLKTSYLFKTEILVHTFEKFNAFGFFCKCDNSFLGRSCETANSALTTEFAAYGDCVYFFYFNTKEFFNCFCDFDFVSIFSNLECVFSFSCALHAFFCDDRFDDDILSQFHYANTSSSFLAASRLTTNFLALIVS